MIRLVAGIGVALVCIQTLAQITVPKGYSVGDIIVIDPIALWGYGFDLPEPLPKCARSICSWVNLEASWLTTGLGVLTLEGKTEDVIREECERPTED